MAVLLSIAALGKSFGTRVLFENLSISLSDGDRTGVIGPNGTGKTTLLEILAGREDPDSGQRAIRKLATVAYVPQDSRFNPDETPESVLRAALADLRIDDDERDGRMHSMLGRAGFEDPGVRTDTLSGGWKKRLAIAAALIQEPDLLILDEPTNHLDLEGIVWLEEAVKAVNSCLVVTHDRYFLENVATRMVELNRIYPQGTLQVSGNYSTFLEKRDDALEARAKQQDALATVVKREIEWLRRGAKARTGKSKARTSSALQLIDELSATNERSRTGTAKIDFTPSDRKTKRLIEAERIAKSMGGRRLFHGLNLTLSPGLRVGLVGANGSGKSTLLKILEGTLAPDDGVVRRADRLQIVSFAQDRGVHLDPEISLRRTLAPDADMVIYRERLVHVAGWAKRFLFREDQLDMPVARLSGGERARLAIARLMLMPADVLLLDEPTNDLDIPTLEALEDSLTEFPGALVLVSHDRYLLDRVSTVVVGLDGGAGGVFADYSQWQAFREEEETARKAPASKQEKSAPPAAAPKKLSYLQQREWDSMEAQILEAEEEIAKWQQQLDSSPTDPKLVAEAYEKVQLGQQRVHELYDRWAELERQVAR
jgi:ATP-binding cassette subfamily F protein uup